MDKKKLGGGILLFVGGLFSFLIGKKRGLLWLMAVGFLGMGLGVWVFVLGLQDRAMGTMGSYRFGESKVQTVYAKGYDEFRAKLSFDMQERNLRRLRFGTSKCGFTVYNIYGEIVGLPEDSFICGDQPILIYEP